MSHEHPPYLQHHFDTPEQQFDAGKLGIWLFLATEILLFGGLFAAYFFFHEQYPATFHQGGRQLDWKLGANRFARQRKVRSRSTRQRRASVSRFLVVRGGSLRGAVGDARVGRRAEATAVCWGMLMRHGDQ